MIEGEGKFDTCVLEVSSQIPINPRIYILHFAGQSSINVPIGLRISTFPLAFLLYIINNSPAEININRRLIKRWGRDRGNYTGTTKREHLIR